MIYTYIVGLIKGSLAHPEEIRDNVRNVGNTLAKAVHDSLRGVSDEEVGRKG